MTPGRAAGSSPVARLTRFMSLESDMRRLRDLEAIRDLPRWYAHCVWTRDVQGAVELFTEDGVMDTGTQAPLRGREALLAGYQSMLGPTVLQPFVHNHVVELDGDRATGTCYLDLRAVMDGRSMIGVGHYEDTYAIEDGRWKFSSRKLFMRYLVPIGESWADQPGAEDQPT